MGRRTRYVLLKELCKLEAAKDNTPAFGNCKRALQFNQCKEHHLEELGMAMINMTGLVDPRAEPNPSQQQPAVTDSNTCHKTMIACLDNLLLHAGSHAR